MFLSFVSCRLERLPTSNPTPDTTSAMVSPLLYISISVHPNSEKIWRLLGYGKLSQGGGRSTVSVSTQNPVSQQWTSISETYLPDFDMTNWESEVLNMDMEYLLSGGVTTDVER